MSPATLARFSGLALLLAGGTTAHAGVGYIVAGAQVLHAAGDAAVVAPWRGQPPIQGFGGYGRIHADGTCLTAGARGRPFTAKRKSSGVSSAQRRHVDARWER